MSPADGAVHRFNRLNQRRAGVQFITYDSLKMLMCTLDPATVAAARL